MLLPLLLLVRSRDPSRLMSYATPYQPPKACKVFTAAGADLDTTLVIGSGPAAKSHLPQFAIIGYGTVAGNLVASWEKNGLGDVTIPCDVGAYIGGGFSKIDSTTTTGVIVVCYY